MKNRDRILPISDTTKHKINDKEIAKFVFLNYSSE